MSHLLDHLRAFNRKERFYLLEEALKGDSTFRLDAGYRKRLGDKIGVPVPADAYVAMDYHLDWIQMALYLAATPKPPSPIPNRDNDLFAANQEDVDLLVAFDRGRPTHLVLVEAKLETGWTNSQLNSKAERLGRIFADGRRGVDLARPHFVLTSPKESSDIRTDVWPKWMKCDGKPVWMELNHPPGLRQVTRCSASGKVSWNGRSLRIDEDRIRRGGKTYNVDAEGWVLLANGQRDKRPLVRDSSP